MNPKASKFIQYLYSTVVYTVFQGAREAITDKIDVM